MLLMKFGENNCFMDAPASDTALRAIATLRLGFGWWVALPSFAPYWTQHFWLATDCSSQVNRLFVVYESIPFLLKDPLLRLICHP